MTRSEDIFKRVYDAHYDEVHAFCARRVGRDQADDCAAEVFTAVWRRIGEVELSSTRGWVFGVARRVVLNQWRSNTRRSKLSERVGGLRQQHRDEPVDIVVRRSEENTVLTVLNQLREADREIIQLAAWEELSGPEIGQVLGISTQAAQQRLHRAKGRLAKRLQAVPNDDLKEVSRD